MSDLQSLLARNRYCDEEWEYASSGRCDWVTESGMTPRIKRCGRASSPDSFYRWCARHDDDARQDNPAAYGK